MGAYIRQLQAVVDVEEATRVKERAASLEAARERLSPLDDRLRRILASIPDELQREGLSLAELRKSLRGRWRGSCHPGELGASLRRGGFVRRRSWHAGEGFSARWYPVATDSPEAT